MQSVRLPGEADSPETPLRDDTLTVAADARIDGRDELGRKLRLDSRQRDNLSAPQLIAHAYRRWGRACLDHLIGDFAFAIWDDAEQRLFCARDAIGARPLYLHLDAEQFVFASDPRAVVACGVSDAINEESVARYLKNPVAPHPRATMFAEVQRLPPGHALSVSSESTDEWSYWAPFDQAEERLSRADAADRLRELVVTAVEDRLPDSGVAAHLSGGLDSSAIAAIAAQTARTRGSSPPLAYAWSPPVTDAFPYSDQDERTRIEEVAEQESIDCHLTTADAQDYRAFLTRDIRATTNGLAIEWATLPQIAERGIHTVLSGWGGDEAATFDARGLLPDLFVRGRWIQLARGLRHRFGRNPRRILRAVRDRVILPVLPDVALSPVVRAMERRYPPSFAHPDLIERTEAFQSPLNLGRERRGSRHVQRLLLESGHLTERMEAWNIWGARHGIRYTYPLTDRRVLEFIYRTPVEFHTSGSYTRHLFRDAMDGVLPDDLRLRKSKFDQATERLRAQIRIDLWHALCADVESGAWDERTCPWIDVPRLREAMQSPVEQMDAQSTFEFFRIISAIEVVHLWERVSTSQSPTAF